MGKMFVLYLAFFYPVVQGILSRAKQESQSLHLSLLNDKMKLLEDKLSQEIQLRDFKESALRREIDEYKRSKDTHRLCQCKDQQHNDNISQFVEKHLFLEQEVKGMGKDIERQKLTTGVLQRTVSNVILYQKEIKTTQKKFHRLANKVEEREFERSMYFTDMLENFDEERRTIKNLTSNLLAGYKDVIFNMDSALLNISRQQETIINKWHAERVSVNELWDSMVNNYTATVLELEVMSNKNCKVVAGNNVRIAFSANTESNIDNPNRATRYKFAATLNVGDAYNPDNGTFVAPVSGTYFFISTIISESKITLSVIAVSGRSIALLYSGANNVRGSGSNSIIIELSAGDEVYVSWYAGTTYIQHYWSTFSGFLLFASE